ARTRLRVPEYAPADQCDGLAAARPARAAVHAGITCLSSRGGAGTLPHVPVREVRARYLPGSCAAEVPPGGAGIAHACRISRCPKPSAPQHDSIDCPFPPFIGGR